MWARLDNDNFVVELINFDPTDKFHPSLIFIPVPDWFVPYINYEYWYENESFSDATGYADLFDHAKAKQKDLFTQAFAKLDAKRIRPCTEILENILTQQENSKFTILDNEAVEKFNHFQNLVIQNRNLLTELEAIRLPENCTFVDAKIAVEQIHNIKPIE